MKYGKIVHGKRSAKSIGCVKKIMVRIIVHVFSIMFWYQLSQFSIGIKITTTTTYS